MSWSDFTPVSHGNTVAGAGELRKLWDNVKALADDDGSGYRANEDMSSDGNYPVGQAIAVCRNVFTHKGRRWSAIPKGYFHIVVAEGSDNQNCQQIALFHCRDFLYYRTKGGELAYWGSDGEFTIVGLQDFDDDNEYRVLDLTSIDGLAYGTWYYVRAMIDSDWQTADTGEGVYYARERDL